VLDESDVVLITILEGVGELILDGVPYQLSIGESIVMSAGVFIPCVV